MSTTVPLPAPDPILSKLLALPQGVLHTIIASVLKQAIDQNDALPTKGIITRFHAKVPSQLAIVDYLTRLVVYTPYPRDAILLSLVYLNRISRLAPSTPLPRKQPPDAPDQPNNPAPPNTTPIDPSTISLTPLFPSLESSVQVEPAPSIATPPETPSHDSAPAPSPSGQPSPTPTPIPLLNSFTLHRLLLGCLLVASKFTSDGFIPQPRAAKVGGVATRELVRLEVEILKCLGWKLEWDLVEVEGVARALYEGGKKEGVLPESAGNSPERPKRRNSSGGARGDEEEGDGAEAKDGSAFEANGSPTRRATKSTCSPSDLLPERPPSPELKPLTPTPPASPSPSSSTSASGRSSSVSELEDEERQEEQEWRDLMEGKIARKPSLNRKLAAQHGEEDRRRTREESGETIKLREGVRGLNFGEVGRKVSGF